MIQRIQTVYLALATLLISLWMFFPLAYYTDVNHIAYQFWYNGIRILTPGVQLPNLSNNNLVVVFEITSIIWLLATTFSYKNLKRQQWMCILAIVVIGLLGVLFYLQHAKLGIYLGSRANKTSWLAWLPIPSIVMCYLAKRAINKDEELLKSVDRIR